MKLKTKGKRAKNPIVYQLWYNPDIINVTSSQ
jgi:hypothetical protein